MLHHASNITTLPMDWPDPGRLEASQIYDIRSGTVHDSPVIPQTHVLTPRNNLSTVTTMYNEVHELRTHHIYWNVCPPTFSMLSDKQTTCRPPWIILAATPRSSRLQQNRERQWQRATAIINQQALTIRAAIRLKVKGSSCRSSLNPRACGGILGVTFLARDVHTCPVQL